RAGANHRVRPLRRAEDVVGDAGGARRARDGMQLLQPVVGDRVADDDGVRIAVDGLDPEAAAAAQRVVVRDDVVDDRHLRRPRIDAAAGLLGHVRPDDIARNDHPADADHGDAAAVAAVDTVVSDVVVLYPGTVRTVEIDTSTEPAALEQRQVALDLVVVDP